MSEVTATVLKVFSDDLGFHFPGDTMSMSIDRHSQLRANGLVDDPSAQAKQHSAPKNKMQPEPSAAEHASAPALAAAAAAAPASNTAATPATAAARRTK